MHKLCMHTTEKQNNNAMIEKKCYKCRNEMIILFRIC